MPFLAVFLKFQIEIFIDWNVAFIDVFMPYNFIETFFQSTSFSFNTKAMLMSKNLKLAVLISILCYLLMTY